MAQLSHVDLDAVLADLQVVANSTMLLGGQLIDFADPYGSMPLKERREQEARQKAEEERLLLIPEELKSDYQPYRPDDYMRYLCDSAWDAMQVSLRRLSVMLEDGEVELLDCQPFVVEHLKTIWKLLQEFHGNKPDFTPGKPDPLWHFTATFGVGMFLQDCIKHLKLDICARSDIAAKFVTNTQFIASPLQQQILAALNGEALKKQPLADAVCAGEGTRLYRSGGIKELMKAGLVARKNGIGYYRPDAPPDGLIVRTP